MAGMGEIAMQVAIWSAIGLCVIQLVLGLVQWAKPNVVIPIIFAILVAFSLLSGLFGMVMSGQEGAAEAAAPGWQLYVGLVILVIQLDLHIAGIRGARALDRIRLAAAQ
jgi:hypothetical protein